MFLHLNTGSPVAILESFHPHSQREKIIINQPLLLLSEACVLHLNTGSPVAILELLHPHSQREKIIINQPLLPLGGEGRDEGD